MLLLDVQVVLINFVLNIVKNLGDNLIYKSKVNILSFFLIICYNLFIIGDGIMKSKRGQALVEFIIILPILIFILLAVIDYGAISFNKSKIENIITDVGDMYKNGESEEEIEQFIKDNDNTLKLDSVIEDKYIKIKLYKKYDYITPGLDKIFKSNEIKVERKLYNE